MIGDSSVQECMDRENKFATDHTEPIDVVIKKIVDQVLGIGKTLVILFIWYLMIIAVIDYAKHFIFWLFDKHYNEFCSLCGRWLG